MWLNNAQKPLCISPKDKVVLLCLTPHKEKYTSTYTCIDSFNIIYLRMKFQCSEATFTGYVTRLDNVVKTYKYN